MLVFEDICYKGNKGNGPVAINEGETTTKNPFFFSFLGPYPQHMEVPRQGVESELSSPTYATATATWYPSCVCDHGSRQRWILNPLSEARDQTCVLMDASQVH